MFDVIEEEDDEDKNNQKNKNLDKLPENNINSKNDHDIFIDSKYSYINSYANNSHKNNKNIENNHNDKNNILSMINNNNQDQKLMLLFESKKNNTNDKNPISKWNHSSNVKNFETDIFNKFSKDYLGQKIFKESNIEKHLHLPNIKSQNIYERKNASNKINLETITDLKSINFLNKKVLNMNSNNYINDNTQATTLITYSTKKFSSSKVNTNMKSMNNDLTQFGMGLISAGSTTNNNIIIPILTKTRPESNFNCGGGILKNFNENFENNGKTKTVEREKNPGHNKSRNFRKKICKSQEVQKRINASMKNKEIYQVFPDLQRIMPTFHKIKIEKGMTNIKF